MSNELVLDFNQPYDIFTSQIEHTDFVDIDRAVSGFIKGLVNQLVVTDGDRSENKEFARFVERSDKYKVYRGHEAEPSLFVRKLVGKFCQGKAGDLKRNEVLPAVLVTRDPSFAFVEGGEEIDLLGCGELADSEGNVYARINKSFVSLTYTVLAVAWNEATLYRLVVGIMMWLRHDKAGRQHVFKAKTRLAGVDLDMTVAIKNRKDIVVSPQAFEFEENRLVSMPITIEVKAEVFEAEGVNRTYPTVTFDTEGDIIE